MPQFTWLTSRVRSFLLLATFAFLTYGWSLRNGFTNWDDWYFLTSIPSIANFDLPAMFTQTTLGHFYPLNILTLALDYQACGANNAFCYHLSSLIFHILNAGLVLLLLRRIFPGQAGLTLLGALVFLLHPVQVESVAWVAARNHLVSGLAYFVLIWTYLNYLEAKKRSSQGASLRNYFLVLAVYALSLLTKSTLAIAPLFLLLLDVLWSQGLRPKKHPISVLRLLAEKLPMLAAGAWIVWFTFRANAIPHTPTAEIYLMSWEERVLWAIRGVFFYFHQFAAPYPVVPYYDYREVDLNLFTYLPLLLAAGASLWLAKRERASRAPLILGWSFFACALGPNLKLIPFGEFSIFNDRYLYVPSFGLVIVFCALLQAAWKAWTPTLRLPQPWLRAVPATLVLALVALLGGTSYQLTGIWENGEIFWNSILERYPRTAMALNNLGRVYFDRGEVERSIPYFEKAIQARPDFALPYYNLGLVGQARERIEDAIASYRKAAEVNPLFFEARSNWGSLLARAGRREEAIQVLEALVAANPPLPEAYYNLATLYQGRGQTTAAVELLERTLQLKPEFALAARQLASIYAQQGNVDAMNHYRRLAETGGGPSRAGH